MVGRKKSLETDPQMTQPVVLMSMDIKTDNIFPTFKQIEGSMTVSGSRQK